MGTDGIRTRARRWLGATARLSGPPVWLMLFAGLGVLVFTILKAGYSSFTHDESLTWRLYVHLDWCTLLAHKEAYTNNHLLNSVLMKWSECAFGSGEPALRLPNLVALAIYLAYGALLVRPLGPWIGAFTFLCLCTATEVIELFALARGYGLSFGFMFMALYHAWRSLATGRWRDVLLAQVGTSMAVLSSFVLLQYALGLAAMLPFVVLVFPAADRDRRAIFLRALKRHALVMPALVLVLAWPLYRVAMENRFEFGHDRGIVNDTFASVVLAAFTHVHVGGAVIFTLWYVGMAISAFLLGHVLWLKRKGALVSEWPARLPALLYWGMLPAVLVVIVLQHAMLCTPYPEVRYSRYLLPLAILFLGALAAWAVRQGGALPAILVMAIAASASVIAFVRISSFRSSTEWQYDMDTDRIMAAIGDDLSRDSTGTGLVTIGHPWLLEPTINFYRSRDGLSRVVPAHRNGPAFSEDYLALFDSMRYRVDTTRYRFIGEFENAGIRLYRKESASWTGGGVAP